MRAPSVARCALVLLAMRAHLKVRGFGPSVAWARRLGANPAGGTLPPDEVARAAYHVALAAAFFPGRAVCLEQSLALYVLLRRRGVSADLRLGVRPYPFMAHAWVELHGEPVNEDREAVENLRPLPEIAA
ncbi:MAG TPA: lasso peptide biosynthesis B2 protein [Longimicrobium sp.]|nr:lasso peptide biosynthesis B2 protein [Longimicrobium sp.]